MTTEFTGNINHQSIPSRKLDFGRRVRTITISDLHDYTNDPERANRLAEALKRENPDFIFVAGDIFHGSFVKGLFSKKTEWDGSQTLESFRKFIANISEAAPVFVTWGNHDLRKMTPENENERISNLRRLEDVRPGQVYPLYNDRVFVNGMEIIGYVPSFELMEGPKGEGLRIQLHGIAHHKFIEEYEAKGVKFQNPDALTTYLGHDPHLIAADETGIGLKGLSVCDFFITGHLHDGYKPVLASLGLGNIEGLQYDRGFTEQGVILDKDGNKIHRSFIWGKTNLCRGIVYIDDNAQQKLLQMPDGKFYKNMATGLNRQIWNPILEEEARNQILNDKLHFMLISEGVAPAFAPKEKYATINVVDFEGKKTR